MNAVEVSFSRASKIWWSYSWRALVLSLPVSWIAAAIVGALLLPLDLQKMPPAGMPAMMFKFFLLWVVMMIVIVAVQIQAMRWMLRTKWKDFRLQAISE